MTNNTEWTKELVQKHAQTAVMVELYTLPFYLTVLTSIKNKEHTDYRSILSICIEEMLHLQLAANLCLALDTQPIFNAPEYGKEIPYLDPYNPDTGHYKLIHVKLDALNETTLDLMLDIETPSGLEEERHPDPGVRAIIIRRTEDTLEEKWNMRYHTTPQYPYSSIGEMYKALVTGITKVGENQFSWKTTNQQALWKTQLFAQKITSFKDAEDAVLTISLQGEGTTTGKGSDAIPPHYRLEGEDLDSGSLSEYSHYELLVEIKKRHQEKKNQQSILDRKFPDVYTATDGASNKEQEDALQKLQLCFANLLKDLDNIWNQGMQPDKTGFWNNMCGDNLGLLPAAENCWKAGVVPKWS